MLRTQLAVRVQVCIGKSLLLLQQQQQHSRLYRVLCRTDAVPFEIYKYL